MVDIAELRAKYGREISRIDRMLENVLTINSVEYTYGLMMDLKYEPTAEYFLMNEAMQTGLVVSYGRLFSSSSGSTQLRVSEIPEELRATHDELMNLRHQRHAHHGGHPSKSSFVELAESKNGVMVRMKMQFGVHIGAAKAWRPLIVWASQHVAAKIDDEITKLSEKSGLRWHMADGPAPPWTMEK